MKKSVKQMLALLLELVMLMSLAACAEPRYIEYAGMTPEQIVAQMTLEQKAAQMVQPAVYNVSWDAMKDFFTSVNPDASYAELTAFCQSFVVEGYTK